MEATATRDRLRWLLTFVILGGVGAILWWRAASAPDPTILLPAVSEPATDATALAAPVVAGTTASGMIGVDVVGAVRRPGLYYLAAGARVGDAVEAAGGLAPNANRDALNFAARLQDEQQLRVPRVGEPAPVAFEDAATTGPQSARSPELLDLNTAGAAALETLPQIGPETARLIVEYRDAHGPFRSIDHLDDIPGIGVATIDALRDHVRVGP